MNTPLSRPVALWLLLIALLIFAMTVLGGVTRLTRSGLSIVEWQPIMGAIPPLSDAQWHETFDKYKQTPEYREVNAGMSLHEFKGIFYVEWAHRLFGRLIGLVFLLPLLYFLARKQISRALAPRLVAIFILGALQGALGWYMVKSGLIDIPRVSPYRLTAHLALAVALYGMVLWIAFDLLRTRASAPAPRHLQRLGWGVTALIGMTIIAGGFVAGNKAGFGYNSFPLMNGRWIPEGMWTLAPWWRNLFENMATVQFDHRLLAYVLAGTTALFVWAVLRGDGDVTLRRGSYALLAAVALQFALGVATLLYIVPIPLAAAHQAGALVVLAFALRLNFLLHGSRRV